MSRTVSRRIAASVAAVAVVAGGVVVGAGVASADPAAPAVFAAAGGTVPVPGTSYPKSASDSSDNIKFTREVVGDGTVAPGGNVTYRTTFSVTSILDRFLQTVVDVPPGPEFTYVAGSAKVNGNGVDTATDAPTGAVTMSSGGWRLSKNTGDTVTFEVTYKAPSNLTVGNVYDSGIKFKPTTWNTVQDFSRAGAWVKARAQNPVEAGTGSLEGIGVGGQVFGSLTDPQGSMTNVIGGILGNVLGNMS